MSKLIKLLEKNKYELTKEDIENNKSDIGIKNKYNTTILLLYLKNNKNPSIKIIKLLEKEKNIFDNINETPLIYYFRNENIKNINKEIIKYFSKQIGFKNNRNETALQYYLECNKNPTIDIIKLLEKEKKIFDSYNETPLMGYCKNIENLNSEIIKYFSEQIGKKNIYGYTALSYYLSFNKNPTIEIIKLLKKEKYIYDNFNNTPLICYCGFNIDIENLNPEIIKYFSNQIGLKSNNKTALIYYLQYNNNPSIESIKYLYKEFGYTDIKNYIKIDLDIY